MYVLGSGTPIEEESNGNDYDEDNIQWGRRDSLYCPR